MAFGVFAASQAKLMALLLLEGEELLLPFTAFRGGDPSAFNVRLALKPSALTASPAPEMRAVFLGLVPTVLTIHSTTTTTATSTTLPHNPKTRLRILVITHQIPTATATAPSPSPSAAARGGSARPHPYGEIDELVVLHPLMMHMVVLLP